MQETTRREIAARLRGLIAGQDDGDVKTTARRLGVDEVSLRMSIDEDSPYPTIDVLIAVIVAYSVDPSYLLTGVYNADVHRQALENPERVGALFGKLWLTGSDGKVISRPTDDPWLHSA